jgi:hypothetical protein
MTGRHLGSSPRHPQGNNAETKPLGGIMKLLAAKQWNKVFYENGQKHRIKVVAELVHRDGNSNAYFSITGEVERQAKNNRWMPFLSGCIHQEIMQHFPNLASLCDIHLSDEDGVPMHAYANAAYWAGHEGKEKDTNTLAKHLRVSKDQANEMTTYINHHYGEFDKITTAKQAWENTCKDFDLPNYWFEQARLAKALLNEMETAK